MPRSRRTALLSWSCLAVGWLAACGADPESSQPDTSTTTGTGTGMDDGGARDAEADATPPVVCGAAGEWQSAGTTDSGRYAAGAALLPGGGLLFAGGWDAGKHARKTAFTLLPGAAPEPAGALSQARNFVAVAALPGGFLFAGGFNDSIGSVGTSDVYDVATQAFSATGKLVQSRELFTATALPDGRVVAVGGLSAVGLKVRASTELYDPASGQWMLAGDLGDPRFGQAAVYVPEQGRVLLGGGKTIGPNGDVFLATLEWFDPATGQLSPAGSLAEPRDRPTASLLPDGRVLFVAGANAASATLTTTEIFDPVSGEVSPGPPLGTRRMAHSAVTLGDGSIVVAGGWSDATSPSASTATAERLDLATMTWGALPALAEPRHDLVLMAVGDCQVVALGGLHATAGEDSVTPNEIETLTFAP